MFIKFDNVTKKFGNGVIAIDNITLSIDKGEFLFIKGRSGAGKTTIAKLLIRELKPTTGKIYIDKQDISKIRKSKLYTIRRNVGIVFQDFKLLMDRTVYENIEVSLDIIGIKKNIIKLSQCS